ncbi:MAG: hypothetical protein L0Y55_13250 [Anaerolineales bacterium]|nr:hypothetical protein [Anaerolineales bacterium]
MYIIDPSDLPGVRNLEGLGFARVREESQDAGTLLFARLDATRERGRDKPRHFSCLGGEPKTFQVSETWKV